VHSSAGRGKALVPAVNISCNVLYLFDSGFINCFAVLKNLIICIPMQLTGNVIFYFKRGTVGTVVGSKPGKHVLTSYLLNRFINL
jgi:hypothetical protein